MIGLWIARYITGHETPLTKWHYVESDIAGRQVTHCGRQLGERAGTVLAALLKPPTKAETCQDCAPILEVAA